MSRVAPLLALLTLAAFAYAQVPAQPPGPAPARPKPAAPSAAAGQCGTCHPQERVLFERSRHAVENVRCVSCHGGNDRTLELRGAHGAGFSGAPSRPNIPRMCASCHSDETMMRPYNLPVDQHALYQTSGHGKALARGDTRVAVCSDCHGAHDVLPPSDPSSRVFPLNVPRTCGTCHGDVKNVAREGGRNTYEEYQTSIHARELFDRGNLHAPTCVSCHGVHGAAPAQVGDVDKVCGQCHTEERRYFTSGPHNDGLERAGLPQCASCHGDHAITAVQPQRLSTLCTDCHAQGAPQEALGQRLWAEYRTAESEIGQASALIERAEAVPLNTEDYRARLQEALTYLRESLPAAHAVDEEVSSSFTVRARSVGQEIESEIYAKLSNLRTRRIVLAVFWFYLLLTILVLLRFKRGDTQA